MSHKFHPKKLEKLNNPERVKLQDPQILWEALGGRIQDCLVDVGAGTGFYAQLLVEKMATGMIYALDISDELLGWMVENLPGVRAGRIQPMKMQESQTPLADNLADAVIMLNLHHELEDPVVLLQDSWRILKPGGKILISDWKPGNGELGPPQEIRKSSQEIEADLAQAGFVEIASQEIFPQHGLTLARKPE